MWERVLEWRIFHCDKVGRQNGKIMTNRHFKNYQNQIPDTPQEHPYATIEMSLLPLQKEVLDEKAKIVDEK